MNVFFTPEARADLAEIAARIARANPARAKRVYLELRSGCEGLADMPYRFQLVPRIEHRGVRRRIVGDFLIFYRIASEAVEILHVRHGAMDYENSSFPEG